LERLRDRIAEEIDWCDSLHNLERLAARLTAVMAEIDNLRPSEEPSALEEIARRRAEWRAKGLPVSAIEHSLAQRVGREHR
jgi:hypothetical protein